MRNDNFQKTKIEEKGLEQKNREKYGDKQHDVISQAYRQNKQTGDTYCGFNVTKYVKRYMGGSYKSNNRIDLVKAIDYISRMLEVHDLLADTDTQTQEEKID